MIKFYMIKFYMIKPIFSKMLWLFMVRDKKKWRAGLVLDKELQV